MPDNGEQTPPRGTGVAVEVGVGLGVLVDVDVLTSVLVAEGAVGEAGAVAAAGRLLQLTRQIVIRETKNFKISGDFISRLSVQHNLDRFVILLVRFFHPGKDGHPCAAGFSPIRVCRLDVFRDAR